MGNEINKEVKMNKEGSNASCRLLLRFHPWEWN